MANWENLPFEIISEIALKLDAEDYVYFSILCRSFHYASSRVKHMWRPKMPWLLLTENTNNNPDYRRKFLSLNRKRCYQLKLLETFDKRCWGSSCGLVVTIDLNRQLHLLHPLTQAKIPLPPQPTMPNQLDYDTEQEEAASEVEDSKWIRKNFVSKAIVLEVSHDDYLVLAIHGRDNMKALAFARPSDEKWTSVLTHASTKYTQVLDVTWIGQRIYILYIDGNLGYFDISEAQGSEPLMPLVDSKLHPPQVIMERLFRDGYACVFGLYIVESLGDLLMVVRHMMYDDETYGATDFEVYRLNFGLNKWEQLHDLGDVSLFVGDNHSMSVHASNIGNFKCNCIYFTDDETSSDSWGEYGNTYDMGVFSMATKTIDPFYDGEDIASKLCTPFWFMPRF